MAATTAAATRPRRPWSALPLFARIEAPQQQLPPISDAASIFRDFSWPDGSAVALSSSSGFNTLDQAPPPPLSSITTTPSPVAAATLLSSTSPTAPLPRPRLQRHRAASSSHSSRSTDDGPGASSIEGAPAPAPAPAPIPLGDAATEDAHSSSEQAANSSAAVLAALGIPLPPLNSSSSSSSSPPPRAWRCAFPGCSSRVAFTRGCDLRKHHRRHSQRWFCRVDAACPRSAGRGAGGGGGGDDDDAGRRWWFASKKDRDRHEAKHCPRIRLPGTPPGNELL
ncbi:C2h2 type zinc finger domain protein [Lasiodiplodia theobromae]|uniref:C2h2 type zinc finger domain protein n=1 Tax=Lasiodiplodia theobromae TaxID=45133 RepID=UPI0015C3FC06|nr:C2h2 type zinc finger domain protein [Lasiodiplodia theobromae]KAF4539609.1 C2h2 type zinc finger domain protein [Lasiodiplodia theobromae]